jgi:hypothetical protein
VNSPIAARQYLESNFPEFSYGPVQYFCGGASGGPTSVAPDNPCKEFLGVGRNNLIMTKTKIHPDLLEIAAMRARWKEERAAGATSETFARWRLRVRAKVLDELRKVLDDDRRQWPDPRKRDLGKPERRKRRRAF